MTNTALTPAPSAWQLPSTPSIREVVTGRVRRAILEQEIRPGTRVRQTQLADALGVSRMPVRDAMQELVAEGLLHALPGGGVQVPAFEADDILAALALRAPLESEAVRAVVAGRPPAEALSRLDDGESGLDFHRALCRLAGNRFLITALAPIWTQAERAAVALRPTSVCRPGSPDHTTIVRALADGDEAAATTALTGHLAAVSNEVAGGMRRTGVAS